MRLSLALAAALGLATAAPAAAQLFPARSGESGALDVPDAEVLPRGLALLGAELRYDQRSVGPADVGPFPLYVAAGFGSRLELGLSTREWGQPGDPAPQRVLFGAALKWRFSGAPGAPSGFALDATLDKINERQVAGSRLIFSVRFKQAVRLAGFVGGELGPKDGLVYGASGALQLADRTDLVLEALGGPRGESYGAALRRRTSPTTSVQLAFNYLPGEDGFRVSLGVGFGPRVKGPATAVAAPDAAAPEAPAQVAPAAVAFLDERPHFRLRMHLPDPTGAEPRALRHGPWTLTAAAGGVRPATAPALRASTPSLEDLADAQLREQEALAEARDRRVRSTAEQLDGRDKAAQDEARRLADRERELAAREQQLEARERRAGRVAAPTAQLRELESLEAQIAAQERNLGAQERSLGAAIDAAQGRERDAAAREDAERVEASRLAASVSGAGTRAQQLDVRKQALGARNRQLAALEARLVARGERIDGLERQLRARAERLDAWQRRLDTRSERLDRVEQRGAEPKGAALPPPGVGAKAAAQAKDKAIFVMVVKSPTAILRGAGAPAAPIAAGAIPAGSAVEKAVAAATVVSFASPAAQLSELDRESVDNIARLAARDGAELLIWARAKDPSLMPEAQRRAAEIRTRVMSVAQLPERQVVTRITTRPGAQGVDVVVSALRETARPAASAAAPAARAGQLEQGEAGKRQIREAVQAAQPSIEACVGELMELKKLPRAEGALKLTVSAAGKVTKVAADSGDLAGAGVADCLSSASGGWTFPPAEAEYVVEVPITVIRGGAAR